MGEGGVAPDRQFIVRVSVRREQFLMLGRPHKTTDLCSVKYHISGMY